MKKKILFLTSGSTTGSERAFFTFLSHIDHEKFDYRLLTIYNDYGGFFKKDTERTYSEIDFYKGRTFFQKVLDRLQNRKDKELLENFYRSVIASFKPDIVYFNTVTLPVRYNFFLTLGAKIIIHGHSLSYHLYQVDADVLKSRISAAELIISSSKAQESAMRLFSKSVPVKIIYPPFRLEELQQIYTNSSLNRVQFSLAEDSFLVCTASSYFNYKNDPVRFVELANHVLQNTKRKVNFIWVGGDLRSTACQMAISLAESLHISRFVVFTGIVDRQTYLSILKLSDILTLMSLQETFSIVTAEALSLGKPAIMFDCGGVSEFVTEDNGVIIPDYSISKMAYTVIEVMEGKRTFDTEKLRSSVVKFDVSSQLANWEDCITRV